MNGIVELRRTSYENACVGYKEDVLNFLRQQLIDYVDMIPSASDFDFEHMRIVKITSETILNIEHLATDKPIMVYNVLFDNMGWCFANITKEM